MYAERRYLRWFEPAGLNDHTSDASGRFRKLELLAGRVRTGRVPLEEVTPRLFRFATDAATLHRAWDDLEARGGGCGPGCIRHDDFRGRDRWTACGQLSEILRAGVYRPGRERVRGVPKSSGRGTRPIAEQCIIDRAVQRAVVLTAQPFLDPTLPDTCCGFRPGRGRHTGLAIAAGHARAGRLVWAGADVRDAFGSVNLNRLRDVLRNRLPGAGELLTLIDACLGGSELPGLRQGGPLSPLMLNLSLDHFLDRPFARDMPGVPLLRYADDLLALGRTREEATGAAEVIGERLRRHGMDLRAVEVKDLGRGESIDWLGFRISANGGNLCVVPAEEAWQSLGAGLDKAHSLPDSPLAAAEVVRGWVGQMGPCRPHVVIDAACERVARLAAERHFAEAAPAAAVRRWWDEAGEWWRELLQSVAAQ
jgi:hypothetical protein